MAGFKHDDTWLPVYETARRFGSNGHQVSPNVNRRLAHSHPSSPPNSKSRPHRHHHDRQKCTVVDYSQHRRNNRIVLVRVLDSCIQGVLYQLRRHKIGLRFLDSNGETTGVDQGDIIEVESELDEDEEETDREYYGENDGETDTNTENGEESAILETSSPDNGYMETIGFQQ